MPRMTDAEKFKILKMKAEGLNYDEIAVSCGRSPTTIKEFAEDFISRLTANVAPAASSVRGRKHIWKIDEKRFAESDELKPRNVQAAVSTDNKPIVKMKGDGKPTNP